VAVAPENGLVRFGVFELDTKAGQLTKNGIRVRLSHQPLQVLSVLVERPGEVVSRKDLHKLLWSSDTFVDFDHGLNKSIQKLRYALGDSPESPRYIETIPRTGYRFIAPVTEASRNRPSAQAEVPVRIPEPTANPSVGRDLKPKWRWLALADRTRLRNWVLAVSLVVLLVAVGWSIYLASEPPSLPRITGTHPLVTNLHTTLRLLNTNLLTDGKSIYFQTLQGSVLSTFQVPVTGGAVSEIEAVNGVLYDISRDGSELLFMVPDSPKLENFSIQAKPLPAGPVRLILRSGQYPIWAADGRAIFFTSINYKELDRADADGTGVQRVATSSDIGSLHLSPDGARIRFSAGPKLWEVGTDGSNLHPILAGQKLALGGAWSPDGKIYFFSGEDGDRFGLWTVPDRPSWWKKSAPVPQQLTVGPNSYGRPTISRDGRQLFVAGEEHQGELSVYDHKSEKFVPYLGGISVCYVDFSRDGQWMAYVSYPEGTLWRSKIDGSEKRQLTPLHMGVGSPRWSPDGKLIVFGGTLHGNKSQSDDGARIYVVSIDGGAPNLLLADDSHPGDPTWSADGKSIAYHSLPPGKQPEVRIFDTQTTKSTKVPGSEGLWSPRWSPDGKYLVALELGGEDSGVKRMMLFTFATNTWQELVSGGGGWEGWSPDSKFVYAKEGDSLIRIAVSNHKKEGIASLQGFRATAYGLDIWNEGWFGWTLDGRPITTRDTGVQGIYAFDLEYK
jgi:DNA-binding winged helix-turn-helix (wHTH) protein/Tol biopolymer transport system component